MWVWVGGARARSWCGRQVVVRVIATHGVQLRCRWSVERQLLTVIIINIVLLDNLGTRRHQLIPSLDLHLSLRRLGHVLGDEIDKLLTDNLLLLPWITLGLLFLECLLGSLILYLLLRLVTEQNNEPETNMVSRTQPVHATHLVKLGTRPQ